MDGGRLVDPFFHMRYFVLESRMLTYYKKKTHNQVPIKSLVIDGSCKVEDRGLKSHHGNMIYVLCIYNKKDKNQRIMMAAFNIPDALIWKEKIESVIDQHQDSQIANTNMFVSLNINLEWITVEPALHQIKKVNELPEQLIGAVRVSHIELKSAIVPVLEMAETTS